MENPLTNKTQALTKSMNVDTWVISKLNQQFTRDSYTEITFSKKCSSRTTPLLVIGPFCTPHSICLNIGF